MSYTNFRPMHLTENYTEAKDNFEHARMNRYSLCLEPGTFQVFKKSRETYIDEPKIQNGFWWALKLIFSLSHIAPCTT